MALVLFLTCLLLALVFLVAGLAKLADLSGSRQAIRDFGVSTLLAALTGTLLPFAELIVAGALLIPRVSWWGALGALALLLLFAVGIGYNLARGRTPDCHCFGQLHSAPVGPSTLMRNLVLAALAGLVVGFGRSSAEFDLGGWLGRLSLEQLLTLIGGVGVLVLLSGILWLLWHILQQQGRLLLRLEAAEARLAEEGLAPPAGAYLSVGLPVDAQAPAFRLSSLLGEALTLESLRAAGKPVLLLFANPGCGPCTAIFPEMGRLQREYAEKLTLVVISQGSKEANKDKIVAQGITQVLLDENREVQSAYRVRGTPSLVLVRPDGSIGSQIAEGADAIRDLVANTVNLPILRRPLPIVASPASSNGHSLSKPGLLLGDPAPEFSLPDLSGKFVSLSHFRGRATLLLFWNPSCGFCQRMLPNLNAWETQAREGTPALLVISTGGVKENRAMGLRAPVLLDKSGMRIGSQFGVHGTPMAVLIDAQGAIASEVATGEKAVLALAGATAAV